MRVSGESKNKSKSKSKSKSKHSVDQALQPLPVPLLWLPSKRRGAAVLQPQMPEGGLEGCLSACALHMHAHVQTSWSTCRVACAVRVVRIVF